MVALLFLCTSYIIGYGLCRLINSSKAWSAVNAIFVAFLVLTVTLYPLHYQVPNLGLWVVLPILLSVLILSADYFYHIKHPTSSKSRVSFQKQSYFKRDAILNFSIIIVTLLWINFSLFRTWIQDTAHHGYIIQQLIQNIWPIYAAFPGDITMCYHVGYDGILAFFSTATGLAYPYIGMITRTLLVGVILYNILDWCTKQGFTNRFRLLSVFSVLFISGFSEIYIHPSQTLTSIHLLITSPSCLLAISVWSLFVNLVDKVKNDSHLYKLIYSAFITILALGTPIYAANVLPVYLLVLGYFGLNSLLRKDYISLLYPIISGIVLIVTFTQFPYGVFAADSTYIDKAHPTLVWQYFSWSEYLEYVTPFVLSFLGPILITIACYLNLIKHPSKFLNSCSSVQLIYCALWVSILPFIITLSSINGIDNFLKIPSIALFSVILIILLSVNKHKSKPYILPLFTAFVILATIHEFRTYPFWVDIFSYKLSEITGLSMPVCSLIESLLIIGGAIITYFAYKRINIYILLLALASVSVLNIFVFRKKYRKAIVENVNPYIMESTHTPELVHWCNKNMNKTDVVFAPEYYIESFFEYYRHNAPKIYALTTYPIPFESVSAISGKLLLNHANFAAQKKEYYVYPIWKAICDWYTLGTHDNVRQLGANYLLYTIKGVPPYIEKLIQSNEISEVQRNEQEGWVMYIIHSPDKINI